MNATTCDGYSCDTVEDNPAVWVPGIGLMTAGSVLTLASIIMFPVRAARRRRVNSELQQINTRLGSLGISARLEPWTPGGPARPLGARFALTF